MDLCWYVNIQGAQIKTLHSSVQAVSTISTINNKYNKRGVIAEGCTHRVLHSNQPIILGSTTKVTYGGCVCLVPLCHKTCICWAAHKNNKLNYIDKKTKKILYFMHFICLKIPYQYVLTNQNVVLWHWFHGSEHIFRSSFFLG